MYSQIQGTTERTFGLSKAGGAFRFSFANSRHNPLAVDVRAAISGRFEAKGLHP